MCSWGGSGKVHSGERGIHPKTGFSTTDANQGGRPTGQGSFGSSYPEQASKQASYQRAQEAEVSRSSQAGGMSTSRK